MSRSDARLLDPVLEDDDAPFAHYDTHNEPLEDRLYLPAGVDPHGDICGGVFAHPFPQCKEILSQRIVRNNNLQDIMRWQASPSASNCWPRPTSTSTPISCRRSSNGFKIPWRPETSPSTTTSTRSSTLALSSAVPFSASWAYPNGFGG